MVNVIKMWNILIKSTYQPMKQYSVKENKKMNNNTGFIKF